MNIVTRLRSMGMRYFASVSFQEKQQKKARRLREKRGEQATVHYFHQVDDPYSHLAVQKLDVLKAHYALRFQPHLVSKPADAYQGSASHFSQWAWRDAQSIAADYNTHFSPAVEAPSAEVVAAANRALAVSLEQEGFAQAAIHIGEALWSGNAIASSENSDTDGMRLVQSGNALRAELGHYQGAMFYFDGEWFWGVDRIRLLEERLINEGFRKQAGEVCVPEPTALDTTGLNTRGIVLEYFPSLRSPYTAIGHQRVLDLITRSGVAAQVRPVMPMMMRGVRAPREKQRSIITDAGREGRYRGTPFGPMVDPFGEPVKQAFALFPAAASLGKGMEFVTAYLNAAWFEGIDITTERGLEQVAANAHIDFGALQQAAQHTQWETVLDDNLQAMLSENLWGVPSFRVSGGNSDKMYACWGQDRIWRVESEIARRA